MKLNGSYRAFTFATTFSTVKPYFSITTSPGALAPNWSIASTSPSKPTYLCQPNDAPISIAKRFVTAFGNTDSLYSADCCSKRSIDGIDTTEASIPSASNAFCASTANETSEPVAIKIASGVSFVAGETTYAPFATPSFASSADLR